MTATMKARPTTYNGFKMRSRLEAGFAAWLDSVGLSWMYEPECLAHPTLGQYLPDFLIADVYDLLGGRVRDVFVEVKPHPFMDDYSAAHAAAVRMQEVVADAYPAALFLLVVNHGDRPPSFASRFQVREDGRGTARLHEWALLGSNGGQPVLAPRLREMSPPWAGEWWKGV